MGAEKVRVSDSRENENNFFFPTFITMAFSTLLFLLSVILPRCLFNCWERAVLFPSLHSARQHFSVFLLLLGDMWQNCGQCTVRRNGGYQFQSWLPFFFPTEIKIYLEQSQKWQVITSFSTTTASPSWEKLLTIYFFWSALLGYVKTDS